MLHSLHSFRHADSSQAWMRQVSGTAGAVAIAIVILTLLCAGIYLLKV
jgi:hypothetical protein